MKKALIAMSGGVDSSLAAKLPFILFLMSRNVQLHPGSRRCFMMATQFSAAEQFKSNRINKINLDRAAFTAFGRDFIIISHPLTILTGECLKPGRF